MTSSSPVANSPDGLLDVSSQVTLHSFGRRSVLKWGLAGFLASVVPLTLPGQAVARSNDAARIVFRNAHTGESFNGVYRAGNRYLPEAFERLNYVLRDHRAGEIFPMDPRIVDVLAGIQRKTAHREPLEVISGYRSPRTNSRLRVESSGVAKNSFHMYGQAIDFRLKGFDTRRLRNIALEMKAGGVGYYPKSNFVHIDTGTIRSW